MASTWQITQKTNVEGGGEPASDSGDCILQRESPKLECSKAGDHTQCPPGQFTAAGDGSNFRMKSLPIESNRLKSAPRALGTPTGSSVTDSNESADETQSTSMLFTNSSVSSQENKTNLIINYLPPTMSQEEVRLLFSGIGEVESCKLVREKMTGESLGYAFVKFYHATDAEKAVQNINGVRLRNKTVKVSLARPSCDAIKGANLYICGLPKNMTSEELECLFQSCGNIITTRILCDPKTEVSRGVAFIRYDQRSEAENAILQFNGITLPGTSEPITVKFANSPSHSIDDRISKGFKSTSRSSERWHSKLNSATELTRNPERLYSHSNPSRSSEKLVSQIGATSQVVLPPEDFAQFTMRVRNSPYVNQFRPVSDEFMMEPAAWHPRIFHTPIYPGGNMPFCRFTNYGYFQRPVALSKFKSSHREFPITGEPFVTQLTTNHLCYPQRGRIDYRQHLSQEFSSATKSLLAPAVAANSGALTSNGWCIFVHNLSINAEDSVLWQLFGPFGAVRSVKAVQDPNSGKCRGYGFVTMSNYEEAVKAINALSGYNLENRILHVSFKTVKLCRGQEKKAVVSSQRHETNTCKRRQTRFQHT